MSEIWTPPGNWTSGEVDSGRFNDEIPGNLRFLYAALPRVYQEPISGGPTSGTTELVVATLVVPEQPIDTIQVPSATVSLSATTAGEQFSARIRETNTSGTVLGQQRDATASVSGGGVVASMTIADGLARSVPAGTAATYVCTIARITGSGTASVLVSPNTMSVLVLPDRS